MQVSAVSHSEYMSSWNSMSSVLIENVSAVHQTLLNFSETNSESCRNSVTINIMSNVASLCCQFTGKTLTAFEQDVLSAVIS